MNANIISNYPYNSFSFNQISGSNKAALVLSGIEQYFVDPIVFVSGNKEQTLPIVSLNFGNKDVVLTNNKHSFQMGRNVPSSKFSFIQFNSGEDARFVFGTKYDEDGTIVRDYINVNYKTGVLNLNKRPYVNYSGIVLVGEGVLLRTDQIIRGDKNFKDKIQIGGPENAIYSDQDYNLIISGLDDTPQGMKFILANNENETSIKFDPDYHGLVFQGDSYFFQNQRPQILNTGDLSLRDIALSDEVVSLTGNQTISGIKTFAEGINLDSIDSLNLSGVDISIRDGTVNLLGTSNIPTLADIFPVSSVPRRYRPMGVGSTTSSSPNYQSIQYFPFLIKKDAVNPQIAIELVSSGAAPLSSFPIRYGIYSGHDGFEGAKLFHSGSINCTTTGIFKASVPLTLKKGPYIVATSNTGVSSTAATFRSSSAQTFGEIFGEPTSNTFLFNGNPTAVFYDTGVDLKATIGSSFITNLARAPIPCIEY